MNFKVGDKVVVIAGSDKGKEGKIIKTLRSENKVVVEGVNIVKKQFSCNLYHEVLLRLVQKYEYLLDSCHHEW